MALLNKGANFLRQRRHIPRLATSIHSVQRWFESPLGQRMLEEQQKMLDQALSCLFGYHLLQLSVHQNQALYHNSRVCHCFSVSPVGEPQRDQQASLCSDWDALPFADESVDVTILHHALDFSDNPHQVLREASRVTIARGYIVIVGFNPISVFGAVKPFAQLYGRQAIWQRNSLRRSRIADWLKFLDCQVVESGSGHHRLPLQSKPLFKRSASLAQTLGGWPMPFGNFYYIVARKDRVAMRLIKPKWLSQTTLVPRPKQAISARSHGRLFLVPDAKPNPREPHSVRSRS